MSTELSLIVVHCLSREESVAGLFEEGLPAVRYEKGRLSAEIMQRHGMTRTAACYVCGPGPMMEAAVKELELLGIDPQTVAQERFVWKQ